MQFETTTSKQLLLVKCTRVTDYPSLPGTFLVEARKVLHSGKPLSPRNTKIMMATLSDPEFHCSVIPNLTLNLRKISPSLS